MGLSIGLLVLLMTAPRAAAEETPFAIAAVAAEDSGRWLYSLVVPSAAAEDAPFAMTRAVANAAGQPSYTLVAPPDPLEEAPVAVVRANDPDPWPYTLAATPDPAGEAPFAVGRRPYAQAAPSGPEEVAPFPFEGGAPGAAEPWPYALPFLADRAIKQGYTLPLPRGVSLVYTYVQRDVKIRTVKAGVNGAPLRDVTNFVNLGSTSHVNVAVGRFDAWLLPFLNVYAMAG